MRHSVLAVSEARRLRRIEPGEMEALLRQTDLPEELRTALPAASDPHLRRLLEECRELLPPKPKAALHARLGSGGAMPDRTLAQHLGMRLNTFLQNITRARRFLAECLRKRGVDLELERS